jgi:regulator of sirC expression with transglutaminase-like and TPR domain
MDTEVTARLQHLLARAEQDGMLAEGALLLAKDEYPELDVARYLRQLDDYAQSIRERLPPDETDVEARLVALNTYLFEELGFSGNTDDYYDPRNSFLNEVLDRKLGIPITLSILYLEIAWRLGLELEGVSFPGHFLVKLPTAAGDMVIDPFFAGTPLSEEDLVDRLEETCGEHAANLSLPNLLEPADNKQILARLLRNLKMIYLQNGNNQKALSALHRILLIDPEANEERRERGEIYERLECLRAAAEDYRGYLETAPLAPEAPVVRRRLIQLERQIARYN